MTTPDQLSESLEDYLETILELQETKTVARSKDIAEKRCPGGLARGDTPALWGRHRRRGSPRRA